MTGLGERVEMSVGISGGHEGTDRAGGGVFAREKGERVDIPGLDGLVVDVEAHEEVRVCLHLHVLLQADPHHHYHNVGERPAQALA